MTAGEQSHDNENRTHNACADGRNHFEYLFQLLFYKILMLSLIVKEFITERSGWYDALPSLSALTVLSFIETILSASACLA